MDIERDGTVDLEQPRDLLRKNTVLVSVCAVDSELGTVQPVREIAEILKEFPNCRLHVDATPRRQWGRRNWCWTVWTP